VVLYGRRRIGKTTLMHHWVQDKPHLFFFCHPRRQCHAAAPLFAVDRTSRRAL
jgi:hypothetical protein